MKITVNKSKETIECTLEDATIWDCIDLVKALHHLEESDNPSKVYHVPVGIFADSGVDLDKWGDLYNLSRGFLEKDDSYRQRLTNRITGEG